MTHWAQKGGDVTWGSLMRIRCPRWVRPHLHETARMMHHRYFKRGLMCGVVLGVLLERHAIESWCSMVLMFIEASGRAAGEEIENAMS